MCTRFVGIGMHKRCASYFHRAWPLLLLFKLNRWMYVACIVFAGFCIFYRMNSKYVGNNNAHQTITHSIEQKQSCAAGEWEERMKKKYSEINLKWNSYRQMHTCTRTWLCYTRQNKIAKFIDFLTKHISMNGQTACTPFMLSSVLFFFVCQ